MYDSYIDNYDRGTRKSGCGCIPILIVFAIMIAIVIGVMYNSENEYVVTVTDKAVKNDNGISKYLIFTEDDEGKIETYEITDVWYRFKFDSSNSYAKLKEGEKYEITTIGWRFEPFSWYENIISAEQISAE